MVTITQEHVANTFTYASYYDAWSQIDKIWWWLVRAI